MGVKDLEAYDQPRKKAMLYGIDKLSNIELLAVILRTGSNKQSVLSLAESILEQYKNMHDLSSASIHELMNITGVKEAKAVSIAAAFEIIKRIDYPKVSEAITNSEDVYHLYNKRFRNEKQEHFVVICLDTKNKIITDKTIFKGTLSSSEIHPREIYKEAIKSSCQSIICLHNHPSGNPTPSTEDFIITSQLVDASKVMGIRFLDHIIIGQNMFYSMLDHDDLFRIENGKD